MADDLSQAAGCSKCRVWALAPLSADDRYKDGAMLHWRTVCPECNCVTFTSGHQMSLAKASELRNKFINATCDEALSQVRSRADLSKAVKFLRDCVDGLQPWPWLFRARNVLETVWQAAERIGDDVPGRPAILMAGEPLTTPVHRDAMPQVRDALGRLLHWCKPKTPAGGGGSTDTETGSVESSDDADGADLNNATPHSKPDASKPLPQPVAAHDDSTARENGNRSSKKSGQKKKSFDATKMELVKRVLKARHIDGKEPDRSTPFKTRELADACGQSESGKLRVSESTARRLLEVIFGSNQTYKNAVRNTAVEFHVKGLGEAMRSAGSVDPAKLAEMIADDGTLLKGRQRRRSDD